MFGKLCDGNNPLGACVRFAIEIETKSKQTAIQNRESQSSTFGGVQIIYKLDIW